MISLHGRWQVRWTGWSVRKLCVTSKHLNLKNAQLYSPLHCVCPIILYSINVNMSTEVHSSMLECGLRLLTRFCTRDAAMFLVALPQRTKRKARFCVRYPLFYLEYLECVRTHTSPRILQAYCMIHFVVK